MRLGDVFRVTKQLSGTSSNNRNFTLLGDPALRLAYPELDVKTIENLWLLSEEARIPSVMPFGKHKGLAIADIPNDYKRWLLNQDNVDPYLIQALEVA